MALEEFRQQVKVITDFIGSAVVDKTLEQRLNNQFPYSGEVCQRIKSLCLTGIEQGWLCQYEHQGLRYGRVIKPEAGMQGYSVDVVDMDNLAGPEHRHPTGEIDLIMPLDEQAQFDLHSEGWLVYEKDSVHSPTVTGGRAIVLYLLPNGAIEFTQS